MGVLLAFFARSLGGMFDFVIIIFIFIYTFLRVLYA